PQSTGKAASGSPCLTASSTKSITLTSTGPTRAISACSKRFPGGMIASMSIPWGASKGDRDVTGYHVVWPRDLVQSAGGLLAAGDSEGARRTRSYLMSTQDLDGHWPQNMWLDGTPAWNGIQMDGTGFVILLADLLRRAGQLSVLDPWPTVRAAAGFLVRHGPESEQDRWEENSGYSTYTMAVEVAALLAAADFADLAGEPSVAEFLRQTADTWNANIDQWTYAAGTPLARKTGVHGYYVRLAPPEVLETGSVTDVILKLKNRPEGETPPPAAAVVSPDALGLVRYGLRSAQDPRILDTIKVIDATLMRFGDRPRLASLHHSRGRAALPRGQNRREGLRNSEWAGRASGACCAPGKQCRRGPGEAQRRPGATGPQNGTRGVIPQKVAVPPSVAPAASKRRCCAILNSFRISAGRILTQEYRSGIQMRR